MAQYTNNTVHSLPYLTVQGYLFARCCRRGKYGLPVGPGEHHKANMKYQ